MCDVRVIHERESLPLRLESRANLRGIHSRVYQLDRYHPAQRLELIGQVDDTHTSMTELARDAK